jgi:hypothetical protein
MNPSTDLSEARRPVARILVPEEEINVPGPKRRPDDIDAPVGLHRFEALLVFRSAGSSSPRSATAP